MPHFDRAFGLAVIGLSAALLAGCAANPDRHARTAMSAPYPPPPRRAEIPPPAPTTDTLWRAGHWDWDGAKYVWARGAYIQRPSPTANWMPGYWEERSGGWVWTGGHWET